MTLDTTFEDRSTINDIMMIEIEKAIQLWGLQCTRYELKEIEMTKSTEKVMKL